MNNNELQSLDETLDYLNESLNPYDTFMNGIKKELDKGCKEIKNYINKNYRNNKDVKIFKLEKNLSQKGYQFYYKSYISLHISLENSEEIISDIKNFFNSSKLENISYKIRKEKFKDLDKTEKLGIEIDIYLDEKYSDELEKECFK